MNPTIEPPSEYGAHLVIAYHRVDPNDRLGMIDIECSGAAGWIFADVGSHFGSQVCEGVDRHRVDSFGLALAKLVRDHFGAVRPLLDHPVRTRPAKRGKKA